MKNPHMGRYYAWALLSRYVKTAIRKVTFTPYYTFNYIPPKTSNRFKFVEFSNWKANKNREKSYDNVIALAVGFIGFFLSKFVYQVLYDDDKGYEYHINYPILCRAIQLIYMDVSTKTGPFFDIIPKNRFQIPQIYPRLYQLIFQTQQKLAKSDEKVMAYRKQLQEFDKKHSPL